jgi:thiol:disulfide interchange protein
MSTKAKLLLNSILGILMAYSLFMLWKVPQPYGKISIAIVLIGLSLNFLKNQRLKITIFSLVVAGSSFVLFAGTQFMLDNIQKRKLFDLDTAVHFDNTSFDEALKKGQQLNKPVFVDFYTAWCGPCLEFSRNVLTDDEVGDLMNAAFINLKFDAEKGEGIALAKRYNVTSYPTLLIIDSQGKVLEDVGGGNIVPNREVMIETTKKYLAEK